MAAPIPTREPGRGLQLPDFLAVESGLYRSLVRALLPAARDQLVGLDRMVSGGDWAGADRAARSLNLGPAARAAAPRVEFYALSAAVFGAALWVGGDPDDTWLAGSGEPLAEARAAAGLTVQALDGSQNDDLRAGLLSALDRMRDERGAFEKAAIGRFGAGQLAGDLNKAVDAGVRLQAGVSANLLTTRMVAFGALSQARESGDGRWQWTAKLDSRTCPVCMRLHGRTFGVSDHLDRLRTILGSQDPETAKALSPWPTQSRSDLERLYRMTDEQLVERRYTLPPAHPHCRCVPVPVGTVPRSEMVRSLAQALRGIGRTGAQAEPGAAVAVPAGGVPTDPTE